jgi:histidinol phosphatase-like enzyme
MEHNAEGGNMIVVDLDGTIADCSHRTHYVKGAVKNWDAFNKLTNALAYRGGSGYVYTLYKV